MKFGVGSIILISGVLNYGLVLFQIASGNKLIKVPIRIHRKTGILLLITATLHGILAIFANS